MLKEQLLGQHIVIVRHVLADMPAVFDGPAPLFVQQENVVGAAPDNLVDPLALNKADAPIALIVPPLLRVEVPEKDSLGPCLGYLPLTLRPLCHLLLPPPRSFDAALLRRREFTGHGGSGPDHPRSGVCGIPCC